MQRQAAETPGYFRFNRTTHTHYSTQTEGEKRMYEELIKKEQAWKDDFSYVLTSIILVGIQAKSSKYYKYLSSLQALIIIDTV
jgi:hypothetical protein